MPELEASFVFTDIEGSTRLWLESPDTALSILARHDELIESAFTSRGGEIRKNTGDGLLAVFRDPLRAINAVMTAQLALRQHASELGVASSVRMAIHTGTANERMGDLFGLDIHMCQRIMSLGRGGHVLLSESTARQVVERLPGTVKLIDIGKRRLKGLDEPQRIYRLAGPGLEGIASQDPPSAVWPGNLREDTSTFIGRDVELAELRQLIQEFRLLTIVGEGGIGKTRLATALAKQTVDRFVDGVWLLELERMSARDALPLEASAALGLKPAASSSDFAAQLAKSELLLVLDGCERMLGPAAELAGDVMKHSARSQVIATSRHRLGMAGEVVFRAPPLNTPSTDEEAQLAMAYDAVALFAARAAEADPTFRLSESSVGEVVILCQMLDGVPLAVEVAAARISSMSTSEIIEVLRSAGHIAGLDTVLTWSYESLEPPERLAFTRVAVFQSPFDVEAAAAVTEVALALPVLASLVDKSLLRRTSGGRFRALGPVRDFAYRRLESEGGLLGARSRHARHFEAIAVKAATRHTGPGTDGWLGLLGEIGDDLNAAHKHAMEERNGTRAMRLAVGASPLWKQRGHALAGLKRLEEAIALGGADDLAGKAHMHAGDLAIDVGAFEDAVEHLNQALDAAERVGDARQRAWAMARLASIPHKQGRLRDATDRFEEARSAAQDAGDAHILAHVLASLALIYNDQGQAEQAMKIADEAIGSATASGDPYALADVLLTMGELELDHGDAGTARVRFREALELAERAGLGDVSAWALGYLGRAALISGDPREAVAFAKDATRAFERSGSALGRPWAMRHLAIGRWKLGDTAEALRVVSEAMHEALELVKPEALMLAEAKGWMLSAHHPFEAAKTLGATGALARSMRMVLPGWELGLREEALAETRSQLDEGRFRDGYRSGEALDLEDL